MVSEMTLNVVCAAPYALASIGWVSATVAAHWQSVKRYWFPVLLFVLVEVMLWALAGLQAADIIAPEGVL